VIVNFQDEIDKVDGKLNIHFIYFYEVNPLETLFCQKISTSLKFISLCGENELFNKKVLTNAYGPFLIIH